MAGSTPRRVSATPATQLLRRHGVPFTEHPYDYVEHGGTGEAARQLGVDEHAVIKTLVMRDAANKELLVLMHGDRSVSTKALARSIGTRSVTPITPEQAHRVTGYHVGGISPFGTRKPLRVFAPGSVLGLSRIYINGGQRGYLIGLEPLVLRTLLEVREADCASVD